MLVWFHFIITTFAYGHIVMWPETQETQLAQMQNCLEEALVNKKLIVKMYLSSGMSLTYICFNIHCLVCLSLFCTELCERITKIS